MQTQVFRSIGVGLLLTLALSGCGTEPTYKKEAVADSLQDMLTKEGINSSVRLIEHTLAIHMDYPDSLQPSSNHLSFGPAFDEVMRKSIQRIHTVALSSNADINFYVLLLSDPNNPGAYLTIVRNLDDVMRANANMFDMNEFFSRSIFEINDLGPNRKISLDQYVQRDIKLPEFLSWQLARRIQARLLDTFHESAGVEVGRCQGEYRNGQFAFRLNVAPVNQETRLNEEEIQEAFNTATGVIQEVLSSYDFEGFDSVRLIHMPTGRNLVLPKTTLIGR